jgi:regulator of sigma E protease
MVFLVKAGQLILSLSILVILHEFGHFFFARLFKTRVEKFYLFFNPWFSLFKFKKGDTEYGVGWLPLGGYVKISGMIDESMDTEQMKQPAEPWEFRSKKAWQRLLIMLGGVLVNFILALVIYAMVLFVWGESFLPTKNATYGIHASELAVDMGLQNGDKIISLDENEIEKFSAIQGRLLLDKVENMVVERDGEIIEIPVDKKYFGALIKMENFIVPRIPFVIDSLPAETHNTIFEPGDVGVSINDSSLKFYDEFVGYFDTHRGDSIQLAVIRNADTVTLNVAISDSGKIGAYTAIPHPVMYSRFFDIKSVDYGFFEAIPAGIQKGYQALNDYRKQFRLIFDDEIQGYKEIGGFGKIASIFPSVWDWQAFWVLTAFLSIMLAFLNVLPIPALDGGHVLFVLYEMITGRKPSEKFLEYAQMVGIIILLGLVLYANGNDIYNFFIK